MYRCKWYAILLAVILAVSGCFPPSVIEAAAAEERETVPEAGTEEQEITPVVSMEEQEINPEAGTEEQEITPVVSTEEQEINPEAGTEEQEIATEAGTEEPAATPEDIGVEPAASGEEPETSPELSTEETTEEPETVPEVNTEDSEDVTVTATEETEEDSALPDGNLSSEEMFSSYVERVFCMNAPASNPMLKARRATAGSRLTGYNRAVYDHIGAQLPLIESGQRTGTIFTIPISEMNLDKTEWTFTELQELGAGTIVGEDGKLTDEAKTVIKEQVGYDLELITSALLVDYPYLLYWYKKTAFSYITPYSLGKSISSTNPENSKVMLTGNCTVKLPVNEEYAAGDYEVDPVVGETVRDAAANAAAIVSRHALEDVYDKLVSYRDEICNRTDYNYEAVADDPADASDDDMYGNPWQLIWVFDNDASTKVVCEGYAKAFKYLFDMSTFRNQIGCIIVASDDHMWNLVSMEDDQNYLVDVTNCDIRSDRDSLFLAGGPGDLQKGYRIGGITYKYDEDTYSVWSDEELTLSASNYCPCYKWYRSETSCLAEGERQKTCSHCGKVVTEEIPLEDHAWNKDYTVISEPTYESAGEKAIFCSVCGAIKEDSRTAIPALTPTRVEDLTITGIVDRTYTGEEIRQDLVVMDGGNVLTEGVHYKLKYSNNWNASGDKPASVTITGILESGYSGETTRTFTIKKTRNAITASSILKAYSNKDRGYVLGAKAIGGKLQYSSDNPKVKVNSSGKVTIKARFLGKATITIKAEDPNGNYKTATKRITVKVVPNKTTITKVSSPSAGKIKLSWKKCWVCTGYVIQFATKSDFSGGKGVWIRKRGTLTATLGSKVSGKKYYLRMRTYTTINNVKYYSDWSNTVTVRVKE